MADSNDYAGATMMNKKVRYSLYFALLTVTLFGYTNCGQFGASSDMASESSSGYSSSAQCDEDLLKLYASNVQPFFQSGAKCASCHIEGGTGLGAFASNDRMTSYLAFNAAGYSKVAYMATNPEHKPPYTGSQNQPDMDRIGSVWTKAETDHLNCVSRSENGGVDESLLTAPKQAPSIYSGTNSTQTLTWDLDLASDLDESVKRSLPARLTIDVKVMYQTIQGVTTAKGYIFSNPTMAMKATGQQAVIEGLFFQINGRPISSQTTFTSLSRVVSSTQAIPLMAVSANTYISPVGTSDTFQLYVKRLVPTQAVDDASPPLTPLLSILDMDTHANDYSKSNTVSLRILRDSGILRWCLSESPTAPANTEATCVNNEMGANIVNGWSLVRPTQFSFSGGNGTKNLYLWIANDSLKINQTAANASIIVDSVAPVAPTIVSITTGTTQVADMLVTHPNESDVTGWCVFEANFLNQPSAPSVNLNDACWRWTDLGAKPTTVGFKAGGNRNVWVYVRDRAGNISAPSNLKAATNPVGAITFSQLTGASGLPTSIFTNRCATCHGVSGAPGFSKLQLFDYTSANEVVTNGQLISRINNVLSPMPNVSGGLMPQKDRDLVRLWTMPEGGGAPKP